MSETSYGAILQPRDSADVAAIVAASRVPLEPTGGGSKRSVGQLVEADQLDLAALTGITSYEPAELVLTARAATPLPVISAALAAQAQRLAFEPPDLGRLLGTTAEPTIGGVLATNLAGSRRVSAGAARDHFLGLSAVTGSGESFRAGGRVVKNVTGYDLPKLLAGSWGTLAVLTEVTVRVVPAPELDRTVIIESGTAEDNVALLSAALGSKHDVSAAAFDPQCGSLLRLEGFAASVEARTAALLADLGCVPAAIIDGAASQNRWLEIGSAVALARSAAVWRISVPPTEAPTVLARLSPERYLLDWGGGLIWAGFSTVDAVHVRSAYRAGHATLIKAPSAARAATPVFQPPTPVARAIAERLKQAFDPRGILNPGRMG